MTEQSLPFQAEVSRLLHIVTHSLYSQKEIFLRELVSNASDACDKLRHAALTQPELVAGESDFRVTVTPDKTTRTLTVADNGIGMDRQELIDNLGTIARSGTQGFAAGLSGDAARDVNLIGQFGVGFYAAFMVAEKVEVTSQRAGTDQAWRWTSDGTGTFTVAEAAREGRGTTIVLHLRGEADEYLEPQRLRQVIRTYSDHIALPVQLVADGKTETVNAASALWTRPKSEVTAQQYGEFYRHVAKTWDEPWLTVHAQAEGKLEYALLVFVPGEKPLDLFDPARRPHLSLYVRRVFITADCPDLAPAWLRFLRGVVDSADLPLNVSREMLQGSPIIARIKQGLVRRVLTELEKKAEKEPEEYAKFWLNFGAVLKEGLYEDGEHREKLLKIARFRSTHGDGLVSLPEYVGRMKEGQTAIYTITGDTPEAVRRSPHLEGFRARGIEVLLLTDPVDDFWLSAVPEFDDKPFQSATRGDADLDAIKGSEDKTEDKAAPPSDAALGTLVALLKQVLGERVKDVRETQRLRDSAACLVAGDGDMDMHLARMLKLHNQLQQEAPRILEINPRHALVRKLAERATEPGAADTLEDAAWLLYDQSRIAEGELPVDTAAFARRLAAAVERGLAQP